MRNSKSHAEKYNRMKQEAEERKRVQEMLEQEQELAKQRQFQKKQELRRVMDMDAAQKRHHKDQEKDVQLLTSDFGENNVLSYVYQPKEHQSYKLGQKNEYLVGLIQKNFHRSSDRIGGFRKSEPLQELDEMTKQQEQSLSLRLKEKKRKELETKIYQDMQVAQKQEKKKQELLNKVNDHERLKQEYEDHKRFEESKKTEKLLKNKKHLQSVIKQMSIEPKMFAKTGVAIVKNTSSINPATRIAN
mmetsp:Transcript_16848/g.28554  ORF Transcript_16848/g.28554 Transcript_16848/m.28554 type:complete len:245 (-) Transcript_16848:9-743(-)